MKTYILIDIGGTAIKYGVMDENENLIFKDKTPTESSKGGRYIQQKVIRIVKYLLDGSWHDSEKSVAVEQEDQMNINGKQDCATDTEPQLSYRACGSSEQDQVAGIAISSAGMVDVERGYIFHSGPTIPGYKGIQFKAPLEEIFGIPCEIENDVNCAGLAEYTSGAGKGASSMLCLTIGTGIGGCAVLHGEVLHGFTGSACEVGYMHMGRLTVTARQQGIGPAQDNDLQDSFESYGHARDNDLQDSFESYGHARDNDPQDPFESYSPVQDNNLQDSFESYGSASALTRRVAKVKNDDLQKWDGLHIFAAAKHGDLDCIRAIDEMCDVLGRGIANICYVLNPEIVVLGGGIMAQKEYLYPRIRAAMDRYLIPVLAQNTKLAMAQQGNDAGMIGAYYHFRQMQKKHIHDGQGHG